MSRKQWPEKAVECLIAMKKNGASSGTISDRLAEGWSLDASRHQIRRVWNDFLEESGETEIVAKVQEDTKIEELKAESALWKRKYQASIKTQAGTESILQMIRERLPAIQNNVTLTRALPSPKSGSPVSAVAPLTDTHIGEVVNLEEMAGLNEYDMEIFSRRLYGWTNKVIELTMLREKYLDVPKLYVPMIGDMISGDIHEELAKSNSDNVMNTMIQGAFLISQSMMTLAGFFPEVHIKGVIGNHGRMSPKPPYKGKYMNWDYILFQMVAMFCSNQKNITFELPKSYLNVFEVEGKQILMMHGDSVNGWNGIPFYGIQRAIAQLRQALQYQKNIAEEIGRDPKHFDPIKSMSRYFDHVLLGHFHTHSEMDIGTGKVLICGCLKGGDEYALGKLHAISKPEHILLFFHPRHGYISKDIIYLDQFDHRRSGFSDALPSVWSDGIM